MTYLSIHPVGSFIRHNKLLDNVRLQHRTVGCVNRTTWRELQALPHSVWHLWPPRCFFRGPKRWKSHSAKTPYSPTDSSLVAAIWMEVSWTSTIWARLQKWVSSIWLSEDESWWLDSKMLRKFRKLSFTIISLVKTRVLCWSHTFTNNTLSNAWTFRVNMEKWLTVLFHIRNAILNKKLPNKEIFTMYSYFLVDLCTTMVCVKINEGASAPYCCIPFTYNTSNVCTNITPRHIRITTIAIQKQELLNILNICCL